ncbi:uncharacterized protein LOC108667300 [Hyalella azteca]|uniref:Uncharacterized protein LOC108667300 n=1 Tax=Hyalella azteca TaxID=294128 RepID=A0A8B7N985_HYAAZ|nr:uncharacterized protein LOC108667300 [Hyalella azteca]
MKTSLLCLLLLVAAAASAAVGEADGSQPDVRSDKDDGPVTVLPDKPQVGRDDGVEEARELRASCRVIYPPYFYYLWGSVWTFVPAGNVCFKIPSTVYWCCLSGGPWP